MKSSIIKKILNKLNPLWITYRPHHGTCLRFSQWSSPDIRRRYNKVKSHQLCLTYTSKRFWHTIYSGSFIFQFETTLSIHKSLYYIYIYIHKNAFSSTGTEKKGISYNYRWIFFSNPSQSTFLVLVPESSREKELVLFVMWSKIKCTQYIIHTMILLTHVCRLHKAIQYKKELCWHVYQQSIRHSISTFLSTGSGKVKQKSTYLRKQNSHTYLLTGMKN
jgi:hypothetical protein